MNSELSDRVSKIERTMEDMRTLLTEISVWMISQQQKEEIKIEELFYMAQDAQE